MCCKAFPMVETSRSLATHRSQPAWVVHSQRRMGLVSCRDKNIWLKFGGEGNLSGSRKVVQSGFEISQASEGRGYQVREHTAEWGRENASSKSTGELVGQAWQGLETPRNKLASRHWAVRTPQAFTETQRGQKSVSHLQSFYLPQNEILAQDISESLETFIHTIWGRDLNSLKMKWEVSFVDLVLTRGQ